MGRDPQKVSRGKNKRKKKEIRFRNSNSNMEDHGRTRSQGPPSTSEENELIQWGSLQDPVRIKREHAEARRLAREANTVTSISEKTGRNQ